MHGNNVFEAATIFTIGAVQQALHMLQDTLSSLQSIKKFTPAATLSGLYCMLARTHEHTTKMKHTRLVILRP